MTDRHAVPAASWTVTQEARGPRRRLARRGLAVMVARAGPILAAALLLAAGALDRPAQAQMQEETAVLTIAAGSATYGYQIDDVVFTVTRAGTTEEEIAGSVTITQDHTYLSAASLSWTFTIPANETTASHTLSRSAFSGGATQTGDLTATLDSGDGYDVGTPGAATVSMVVADPAITVRPEHAAYSFDEDDDAASVTFIARTASGLPRPGSGFRIMVSAKPRSDGAGSPDDYAVVLEPIAFASDDFTASGDEWEARKEVALTLVDDGEAEEDETFDLELELTAGLPQRIRLRQADGSACPDEGCLTPVTIRDNDGLAANGLAITPVPPAASADHGPNYSKAEFLALPDGTVHGRGATLTFTLTLDEAVTVTGTPELVLDIFARERRARYTGGSGTDRLTFAWTVAKGDNDPDGLEFRSLDLRGGSIRDGEGHDLRADSIPARRFAEHRVRGGLFAMRLEAHGSAREGEPFEFRVIRDGGYDEVAVAGVAVADSFLPLIEGSDHEAVNGPGHRQMDFDHGAENEPGVRVSTRTVTPPGDGIADASRTLTIRLTGTDAGFYSTSPLGDYRAWYLTEGSLEATVPVIDTGRPLAMAGLRVHRASAREAPGAKLVFRVTLSPHGEAPVTVDYRTGDDPHNEHKAVADEDYMATDGMLTFEPGETEKTVEVEVLADDHDEGFETMRLFLSNAVGARIDTASALGIIKNDGPIPRAWIARLGRTVADQVLGAVESRMRAARKPGVEVTLAGQRVGGGVSQDNAGATRDPDWEDRTGFDSLESRGVTHDELMNGASFAVTEQTGRGDHVTLWGRGAVTRFDDRGDELTLDGEVASAMVGVDWAREDWTAGLIVSRSDAEGGYAGHGKGRVEATVTGLYPWGRLALSDRVDAWGAVGYGTGELAVTLWKPGTDEDGATVRTDLHLRMAAAGLRGVLVDGGADGLSLAGKTDVLVVQTVSDATRGPDGGSLAAASATVTRLRLGLEAERPLQLGDGDTLTPSAEIGVRRDGGDAETGFGVDIGGGIAWSLPAYDLELELRGHGLLTHEAEGFRERGFSGSLAWDPTPSTSHGPALTLTQTVGGEAYGGADALLARGTLAGLAAQPGSAASDDGDLQHRRLEARLGYGFPAWGGRFASVPEIGFALSDTGREYIFGWRLMDEGPGTFRLSTEARRHEAADGGAAEHRIGARLSAQW